MQSSWQLGLVEHSNDLRKEPEVRDVQFRLIILEDLDAVLRLCEAEGWASYCTDRAAVWRAFTGPGVWTVVTVNGDNDVVGLAQMQSDGVIQAHLSLIAVDRVYGERGVGRQLVEEAFRRSGGTRIDLLSDTAAEFYRLYASGVAGISNLSIASF